MTRTRSLLILGSIFVLGCSTPSAPPAPPASSPSAEPTTMKEEPKKTEAGDAITITDPSQREANVGKTVAVVGIQTRTKQPQVNGVDVDGAYDLSDKKVVARGVLEKHVVNEPPAKDGMRVASRGNGTFYSVVDPQTKRLATTKLAE